MKKSTGVSSQDTTGNNLPLKLEAGAMLVPNALTTDQPQESAVEIQDNITHHAPTRAG